MKKEDSEAQTDKVSIDKDREVSKPADAEINEDSIDLDFKTEKV